MLTKIFLCTFFFSLSFAFSIPGVSVGLFQDGETVPVYANELDSVKTQLNFEYYYLKFCSTTHNEHTSENLGSKILGETTQTTPYKLNLNKNTHCNNLCSVELEKEDAKNFEWMIERQYFVNLVIDNLPAIYQKNNVESHVGFPVGYEENGEYYIYNHIKFHVYVFNMPDADTRRIVGFGIEPLSLGAIERDGTNSSYCEHNRDIWNDKNIKPQKVQIGSPIHFSYDVIFEESDKSFGSRWDHYRSLGDEKIHWLSLLNSLVINVVLTAIIAYIMRRTVSNDIRMYNELRTSEEVEEDSGWKQLSRDVFRPPKYALLLSVFTGTGIQLGSMMFLILLFSCFGFMDQTYRGSLVTTVILFYNFLGAFSGYYSARIYKMFNGPRWVACTLLTALFYPGINFIIFYVVNIMLIFEESSSAVHTGTVLALMALWFGISMPLVFLGSLIGYKKPTIQNPCKYNPIPKFIKPQPWYLNTYMLCILGGLLPFGSVFIELVFMMMSIWRHSFYYLFAFLFAVAVVLVVTCVEISIVITYLQLCNGNHKIWWRSFLTTGSIAIYTFAYAIFYYVTELEIVRFSSMLLYFGYNLVVSLTFFILCGTIGFLSSYVFVKKIYASIKID